MKRGDIGLLSIGIKRRFNPIIGIGSSQKKYSRSRKFIKNSSRRKESTEVYRFFTTRRYYILERS
jgi:hypothetical protein